MCHSLRGARWDRRSGPHVGSVTPGVAAAPVCPHTQLCPCGSWLSVSGGLFGSGRTSAQLHVLVPISAEHVEEAEKEDLRAQLKRQQPPSPLPGSKAPKRPKIKVALVAQGDPAGGPSPGGAPEGKFPQPF